MKDEQNKNSIGLKIVLIGPIITGKTCILHRFIHNEYRKDPITTIGGAYIQKTIQIGGYNLYI